MESRSIDTTDVLHIFKLAAVFAIVGFISIISSLMGFVLSDNPTRSHMRTRRFTYSNFFEMSKVNLIRSKKR